MESMVVYGALRPSGLAACGLIRRLHKSDTFVLAVDLPSGINTDTGEVAEGAAHADLTVTFDSYKPLHMAELLGTPGDYGRITTELSGVIFKDPCLLYTSFLDGSSGFVNHDGKGLEFDHYPDHQKVTLSWTQVEKYIDLMIQSDRYLTDKEKEHRAAVQEAERQLPMLDGDAAAEYLSLIHI